MNTWHGAGRIGGDAVTRQTKNGDKVTGFSVAIDERRGGEKTTLWANCSMWGERGEKLAQYLTKGTSVAIAGPISLEVYEGQPKLKVDVREVTLLGSAEKSQGGGTGPTKRAPDPRKAQEVEDDIPFIRCDSVF
jgi:single-strand DNA-binding protein